MFDRFITFQARQRPRASAIVTVRGDITFAQFDDEIGAVAAWAQGLGLHHPAPVAVRIADRYLHWLVLLGLARIGVATASVPETATATEIERLAPQALITDRADEASGSGRPYRCLEFSVPLAKSLIAGEDRRRAGSRCDASALARVAASSGTTGTPKAIGFSWSQIETRFPLFLRTSPQIFTRLLALVGPEMGGFEASLCAWASGGAVVFGPRTPGDLAAALPQLAPAALAGAPVQLQLVLNALPEGFLPLPNTRVSLFGAHTPADLRRALSLRLSADVANLYGSTEAGLLAWASAARLHEPTAAGFVPPWVELEVVDEDDRPVAADEPGVLRVRGPGVATGYLHDAAATAAHFRDGWFYPGDTGRLAADGLLHLHARADEVMNLGGDKVLPVVLEDAVRGCPGVRDAGAFMAPERSGSEAPWIAIVADGEVDRARLNRELVKHGAAGVNLAFVREIPRNARGKILRAALRDGTIAAAQTRSSLTSNG